ncbi:MAG: type II toxin-antitoxin system PemK/MazF family toxin [Chloroflexi bacterium]|nr:type II toxin-antitoxin system PemK/MazF family toxin [Chloroflexota bacterium]
MKKAGQVVLFKFPQTDLAEGKLRPALLLAKLPNQYDDWLICMISTQTRQAIENFDDVVNENDSDFTSSGLKVTSVIRVSRLAVVNGQILLGAIGEISIKRLKHIKQQIVNWILQS